MLLQITCIFTIVVMISNLNPINSHCHLLKAKQASFHAKKKTSFFIHATSASHNTGKHYRMSSFSHSVVIKRNDRVQAIPRHACNNRRLRMKQDNGSILKARCHTTNGQGWLEHMTVLAIVIRKRSLNAKVDQPFDNYVNYYAYLHLCF